LVQQKGHETKAEEEFDKAEAILKKAIGESSVEISELLEKKADLNMKYDRIEKAELNLKQSLKIKCELSKSATSGLDKTASTASELYQVEISSLYDKLAQVAIRYDDRCDRYI